MTMPDIVGPGTLPDLHQISTRDGTGRATNTPDPTTQLHDQRTGMTTEQGQTSHHPPSNTPSSPPLDGGRPIHRNEIAKSWRLRNLSLTNRLLG